MVELYSDWCGPCKSVLPTLKRLRLDKDDEACLKFLLVRDCFARSCTWRRYMSRHRRSCLWSVTVLCDADLHV